MIATHLGTVNDLNLSLDIATLLQVGTAAAHAETQQSEAAGWLTRGELDRDEYIRFLIILWHLYSNLEEALERHASHPVLAPTYNPTLLSRNQALSSDIAHLLATPESMWHSHPIALAISSAPPKPLADCIERIRAAALSPDPSALLAHAYVRYLGDLSGGQIIRRRIAKAYDLDVVSGLGTEFYGFQKLGGGGVAGIGDMGHIKEWYRAGMNRGVGDDRQRKATLVQEAIIAFRLNNAILATLCHPSLSEPEPLIDVVNKDTKHGDRSTFTVTGVLSIILTMSIAHFLLTGGFLGNEGLEKWNYVRMWLGRVFGISVAA